MTKGVIFGVISCITLLPAMIMIFDKLLTNTMHRLLIPEFPKASKFVVRNHTALAVTFAIFFVPFAYFQSHAGVYYNLDKSLPDDLPSIVASKKISDEYDQGAAHMLLIDKDTKKIDKYKMIEEMKKVDGVQGVIALESAVGPAVPDFLIPEKAKDAFESDNYELMLVLNKYKVASKNVNKQIVSLNKILKHYDKDGMLVGEAPCTKDLIDITDHDFKVVSAISIIAVFFIIFFVFKSVSLPLILILIIEGAIFINMGIPYLTGTKLPFIASIVIGTIQLGATVDYAILMTSRYERERGIKGKDKGEAIRIAHMTSFKPVLVSGLSFFAATFGVGLYSKIDMISSLCLLMSRGALISVCQVLLFLPAMFWIFDGLICKTSKNFKNVSREDI